MADQNMDDSSQNEQPVEENVSKPDCSEKESTQVYTANIFKYFSISWEYSRLYL